VYIGPAHYRTDPALLAPHSHYHSGVNTIAPHRSLVAVSAAHHRLGGARACVGVGTSGQQFREQKSRLGLLQPSLLFFLQTTVFFLLLGLIDALIIGAGICALVHDGDPFRPRAPTCRSNRGRPAPAGSPSRPPSTSTVRLPPRSGFKMRVFLEPRVVTMKSLAPFTRCATTRPPRSAKACPRPPKASRLRPRHGSRGSCPRPRPSPTPRSVSPTPIAGPVE